MAEYKRRSPVIFPARPARSEQRDGWEVVLQYSGEGEGPWVVDLGHKAKWDVQSADLSRTNPCGIAIPSSPGKTVVQNGMVINRMNGTQASVWHLGIAPSELPGDAAFTDMTDAVSLLALMGKGVLSMMESLSALDLLAPDKQAPFLLQGPVAHLVCQVVVLDRSPGSPLLLLACSSGYGQSMAEAILDAGSSVGIRPAGEDAFVSL